MRRTPLLAAAAFMALAAAACSTTDQPTAAVTPPPPAFSSGVPNLGGLPDLIVDEKATQQNWIVRVEDLPANFCSV